MLGSNAVSYSEEIYKGMKQGIAYIMGLDP